MARRLEEVGSIALVERAIADIRRGRMVILTDDEDRENEGDLVMAAEKVTPAAINFMATHARGLICLSLTESRILQLNLPLMVQDNTSPFGTAFTVSIEAATGVTTGISAADRARTILAAVAPRARPGDLVRPGHVFPLRAREGGVLVRTGQTEGSVDLARLAGLFPAGVICEVMNRDGTMARRPELLRFARRHKLTLCSVADLIRFRLQRDRLVKRMATTELKRAHQGVWTAHAYQSDVDSDVHVAMVRGDLTGPEPVLTRMHRACPVGDLLGSAGCECGQQLDQAFRAIAEAGRGVLVYLHKDVSPRSALACTHQPVDPRGAGKGGRTDAAQPRQDGSGKPDTRRLREFGVGAQILKDLGLRRLRLLTNNPKKIVGLESYNLEVVEQIPLSRRLRPLASKAPGRGH